MSKSKYNSHFEWKQDNPKDYFRAYRQGLLNQICDHYGWDKIISKKTAGYWTKERCIEDAKKCRTRTEWQRKLGSSYLSALKNGWTDECCEHMVELQKPNGYWNNKERCIEDAKKYTTKTEWAKNNSSAYLSASKNGWMGECCEHMIELQKPSGYWTKELCIEDAKKYKSKGEWKKKSNSSYHSATKNGWIRECSEHMIEIKKPSGYWTKERCIEDAKKYSARFVWQKKSNSAYNSARINDWVDECCEHMK